MSEIAGLLAQIGGALSAQGVGGKQGLQQFMANLSKRQLLESQQNFAREAESRQHLFQLGRDRSQQAHEERMLDKKTTTRDQEKAKLYSDQGALIYSMGNQDPSTRATIEASLLRNGVIVGPLNWPDRQETIDAITLGAKFGFGPKQAQDQIAESAANEEKRRNLVGEAAIGAPPITPIEASKLDIAHNAAKADTDRLGGELVALQGELAKLNQSSHTDMPLDAYHLATVELGKKIAKVKGAIAGLSTGNHSRFFGPGADLRSKGDALATQVGTLGDSLLDKKLSRGEQSISYWDLKDPGSLLIFQPGGGGNTGEEAIADSYLRSEAFKAHAKQFQPVVDFLLGLPSADTGTNYLTVDQEKLRSRLIEARTDKGKFEKLDLEYLMRKAYESREPSEEWLGKSDLAAPGSWATSAVSLAPNPEHQKHLDLVSDVAGFPLDAVKGTVNTGIARRAEKLRVEGFSSGFRNFNSLGASLFPNATVAKKAIATHGEDHPTLGRVLPTTPEGQGRFVAAYLAGEGINHLVDTQIKLLVDEEPGGDWTMDPATQVKMLSLATLKRMGMHNTETEKALSAAIQDKMGASATFSSTTAEQLHDYDVGASEQAYTRGIKGRSSLHLLPKKVQESWNAAYKNSVLAPDIPVGAIEQTTKFVRDFMRQARGGFDQGTYKWWQQGRFDTPGLQLKAELAGEKDEVATFYDVFSIFKEQVPTIAGIAAYPGSVSEQAKTSLAGRFTTRSGLDISTPASFADWASGSASAYIRGHESFARKYEEETGAFGSSLSAPDPNTASTFGFLDLIRGYDLKRDVSTLKPAMRQMLMGIQEAVRGLDYGQAKAAFTGANPIGLDFEAMGLAATSTPVVAASNAASVSHADLVGESLRAERIQLDRARGDVTTKRRDIIYDTDNNPDRVNYQLGSETLFKAEAQNLERADKRLRAKEEAARSSLVINADRTLAAVLTSASWKDQKTFAKLLGDNRSQLTGEVVELGGLDKTESGTIIDNLADSASASMALQNTIRLMSIANTQQARQAGQGLSTTERMENRNAVLSGAGAALAHVTDRVGVLANQLQDWKAKNEVIDLSKFPHTIGQALAKAGFFDMPLDSIDDYQWAALKIWAVHKSMDLD